MNTFSKRKYKILVCSLHFGAGHTAHLNAYSKLLDECGYEGALYLDKQYMSLFNGFKGPVFFSQDEAIRFNPDIIWIYNVGLENIDLIKQFKKNGTKIAYVLHEPYMGLKDLMTEGKLIFRKSVANVVNYWTCSQADHIILCSSYAVKQTKKFMPSIIKKSSLFPLIFMDDMESNIQRKYFSLIGAFSHPHGSDYYLRFVKESLNRNNICFQIATRTAIEDILKDPILQEMKEKNRLIIQQGRPLTEKEMNLAYRNSLCTWNGYRHCMQSGVLANSFMQGTPVIATHLGSFDEYINERNTGIFINAFDYNTIFNAFQQIKNNVNYMSQKCRNKFLDEFYYRNQQSQFKQIVDKMMN